jgi:hypothetical protein
VRLAYKDLRRQVLAQLATERTRYDDGLEGERPHSGRHIAPITFARHYELLSLDNRESECHETSIGEYKGKFFRIPTIGSLRYRVMTESLKDFRNRIGKSG